MVYGTFSSSPIKSYYKKFLYLSLLQLVHCNINNLDDQGNFAPTVLLYNDVSTRSIFVKFFMGRSPEIQVKKLSATEVSIFHYNQ